MLYRSQTGADVMNGSLQEQRRSEGARQEPFSAYEGGIDRPVVVWFTGLSGAGKSTLARWLAEALRATGRPVEELDGDAIRARFPAIGFTRADRDAHVKRVGQLASAREAIGVSVVVSLISPYEESRRFVRSLCRNFVEVYVATPLAVCEQRDAKGLYARARAGAISHFTGIDDPYEPPSNPEIVLDTTGVPLDVAGARLLEAVRRSMVPT
jgi:adenylylsulfate kinase